MSTEVDRELVADATRAAAEAPLREATHALLVRILAGAGRQADALRAAHAFRMRLVDETGLDPGPDLTRAEDLAARGALTPGAALAEAPTARPTAPRPASPMVGREHDLAALQPPAGGRAPGHGRRSGRGRARPAWRSRPPPTPPTSGRSVIVVELAAVTDERRVPGPSSPPPSA